MGGEEAGVGREEEGIRDPDERCRPRGTWGGIQGGEVMRRRDGHGEGTEGGREVGRGGR